MRAPEMDKVFVAYPFRPDTQAIVDGVIRPVLHSEGLRCITGHDRDDRKGELIDELRKSIANCSALVAVVSGQNPSVFFEIGVATTLKKPCILLASTASDTAMLEGVYPFVITSVARPAMQELRMWLRNRYSKPCIESDQFSV